jgi:hypothetical protein
MEDKSMGEAKRRKQAADHTPGKEKQLRTATRSGLHADIIEAAAGAIDRGIHPFSQEIVDVIQAAYPAANRHEAEAAAEFKPGTRTRQDGRGASIERKLVAARNDARRTGGLPARRRA